MMFWAVVTTLITVALLILILPLVRKKEWADSDVEVEQRNIQIAREKLAELKRQLEAGALTQQQYNEQFVELELALKNDLEAVEKRQSATQGRWVAFLLLLFVPVLSVLLYFVLGDPDAIAKQAEQQQMMQKQQQAQADIERMVSSLAQRLQKNPDDLEGWMMLGRSFLYMKRYQAAADAFAQAYRLQPENVAVVLQYADALAAAHDGKLSGKPAQLIEQALRLQPDNQTALWMSGLASVEAGQLRQALETWQKLAALTDKKSPSYSKLSALIQALQQKLAENDSSKPVPVANATGVNIQVQVDLSEAFKNRVNPDDTVFIYARALNGPKMPLAIVRKQVKDLPITVNLNDSMAMMPTMKLSTFKQLEVVARVSKSGNAMVHPGDLIGKQDLKKVQAKQTLSVIIDGVVN
ncbi:c-type cytochrome biogenesis protein CcmI [methane-oxidizing endosymbiont of Gigantopelta aegis]|uniref:c-type cytochrome biogenesis protein CcmI n=1 Tax=methane-oxidizing endosymbiont of Gigantopelta aegis TaxID=2794938 RepID=UPI001FD95E74|nr:c-type cytochrome biogenesis protein CcmI [methane-oxidizing endosymbiont of Gigantopelta aegis]